MVLAYESSALVVSRKRLQLPEARCAHVTWICGYQVRKSRLLLSFVAKKGSSEILPGFTSWHCVSGFACSDCISGYCISVYCISGYCSNGFLQHRVIAASGFCSIGLLHIGLLLQGQNIGWLHIGFLAYRVFACLVFVHACSGFCVSSYWYTVGFLRSAFYLIPIRPA
jgi:hypothetical protein